MALASRELTNRRILEELELNKKLLKQGVVPAVNSNNSSQATLPGANAPNYNSDFQSLPAPQRNALNVAHSQSYGYYIPQDSSFGNVILPVLPRFDKK